MDNENQLYDRINDHLLHEFVEFCYRLTSALLNDQKGIELDAFEKEHLPIFLDFIKDSDIRTLVIYFTCDNCLNISHHILDNNSREKIGSDNNVILIIKNSPTVNAKEPINTQLSILNIPQKTDLGALNALVNSGVTSMFETLVQNDTSFEKKTATVNLARSRIGDLSASLHNLQKIIAVPNLRDSAHPMIRDIVEKGANENNYREFLSDGELSDSNFLNSLQKTANKWIKLAQSTSRLTRSIDDGPIADEVTFWINLGHCLKVLEEQMRSTEVQITLSILTSAKRFHVAVSFLSDTGISDRLEEINSYNHFMKDFPVNALELASTFSDLCAVVNKMSFEFRKLRHSSYPLSRLSRFVEIVSKVIDGKIKDLAPEIMKCTYDSFKETMVSIDSVLDAWETAMKDLNMLIREISRKRSEKMVSSKLTLETDCLRETLATISIFRKTHEDFVRSLKIMKMDSFESDIDYLYEPMGRIDPLRIQTSKFKEVQNSYAQRLSLIENKILNQLQEELESCKTARAMFGVFGRYRPVITRPSIKAGIREFRNILVSAVQNELISFKERLQNHELDIEVSRLKDLPPISATVIWARQMQRKVHSVLSKLDLILGAEWENSTEGIKINAECNILLKKLDEKRIIDSWIKNLSSQGSILDQSVLKITKTVKGYAVSVNFDVSLGLAFKESRNLLWMGFTLNPTIMKISRTIRNLYPHAIELSELLQTFMSLSLELDGLVFSKYLLKIELVETWQCIGDALNYTWNDVLNMERHRVARIIDFPDAFDSPIYHVKEHINRLVSLVQQLKPVEAELNLKLEELRSKSFSFDQLSDGINEIQKIVERIELIGCEDMNAFVQSINNRVEDILFSLTTEYLIGDNLPLKVHTISIKNGVIFLSPSLEETKSTWVNFVQQVILTVIHQKLVFSSSSVIWEPLSQTQTYGRSLAHRLKHAVNASFKTYESNYRESKKYFKCWQNFGALWNLTEAKLSSFVNGNLKRSLQLQNTFLESKRRFQSMTSTSTSTMHMIFHYNEAQLVVSDKFHKWEGWINSNLLNLYGETSLQLHNDLDQSRLFLEENPLDLTSLQKISHLMVFISRMNESFDEKTIVLNLLKDCRRAIHRSRIIIPTDFTHYEQLESDLKALRKITSIRESSIHENEKFIASRIEAETLRIETSTISLKKAWENEKLLFASTTPNDALTRLKHYGESISTLNDALTIIEQILKNISIPYKSSNGLAQLSDEVNDYSRVWLSIERLWNSSESILSKTWSTINISEVENEAKSLLQESESRGSSDIQYGMFQNIVDSTKNLISCAPLLFELEECNIEYRHWRFLFQTLSDLDLSDDAIENQNFTLRDVLTLNLLLNEQYIHDIVRRAKSEQVISQSIETIQNYWKQSEFTTFKHKSGLTIIKNWAHLFERCNEDLEILESMKASPYFKIFEQDALEIETKLSALNDLFTSLVEAQKLWMYMYEVLGENDSIKSVLQAESIKFNSITANFKTVLDEILKVNAVLDILHQSNCIISLKRITESLNNVGRALNDYLELQRKLFPRFYFVGNDDLLQIIGAGTDLRLLSNLLEKLFSGVSQVEYHENTILGVSSSEGESLTFEKPIEITSSTLLHGWMSQLDLEIKLTLSASVEQCIKENGWANEKKIPFILKKYTYQVLLLSLQIFWSEEVKCCIKNSSFEKIELQFTRIVNCLLTLLELQELEHERRKVENLIIEGIHMCDVVHNLRNAADWHIAECIWDKTQKFNYDSAEEDPLKKIGIELAGHSFHHGLEYIGVPERIIYTPLMENCCVSMIHALSQHLGGSPFGPAGTGKTETIKALGQNFGRMVIVLNCDDSFDFQSMGRLLFGIAQIGAWSCFDEFNRLEENILSAVSTQIELIQKALINEQPVIEMLGKKGNLNRNTGLFVTMNRGYDGRSELPENLKKKFREFNMKKPNKAVITDVLLRILRLPDSSLMAERVVKLFKCLEERCSNQKHYDFGLRALKGVLKNCRTLLKEDAEISNNDNVLIRSLCHMVLPKLTTEDEEIFYHLISDIFGVSTNDDIGTLWINRINAVCSEHNLTPTSSFLKKCVQFYYVQRTQQAIILVGEAGFGKTSVWRTMIDAMKAADAIENAVFVIDSKVLTKEQLYGNLDPITFEWTDGLFTAIIRKININSMGTYDQMRIWVVFDSELDPNYAETLNSALDDNKLLTLPNGERLKIPSNLHIIFEVQSLKYTTPATISRCGMIFFGEALYSYEELLTFLLKEEINKMRLYATFTSGHLHNFEKIVETTLINGSLSSLVDEASNLSHISDFDVGRVLRTFVKLICVQVCEYNQKNESNCDFQVFVRKQICITLLWSMAGDCAAEDRLKIGKVILKLLNEDEPLLVEGLPLDEFMISIEDNSWISLSSTVSPMSLEPQEVLLPHIIIPTIDTAKHESLFFQLLESNQPFILCGPPGSGKTMSLFNALKTSNKFEVIGLTFSKEMSVRSFLKTLTQHTVCSKNFQGTVMKPKLLGKELVIFCDEINLPELDKYGSQPLILLLRQLIEKNGFWDTNGKTWISVEGIHIVGACNPSDNNSRIQMTKRFTRHTTIIMVDYPGKSSLTHIYTTFFKALFKLVPNFRDFCDDFANASIDIYYKCQERFSKRDHYIFSPRELTRWVKGMYNILIDSSQMSFIQLIECWIYEASRIFSDRLVEDSEKAEFRCLLISAISIHFKHQFDETTSFSDILFSDWISLGYRPESRLALTDFIKERLNVFSEEELNTELILHNDMVDHMLRIDRALKQVQGHCILVGPSRSCKATLTRFVSWMNGLQVVQLNIHRKFNLDDFDAFLRRTLLKCAVDNQGICLLIDESNILESAFLERMNTLLANSDIPGLFESDDHDDLILKISRKVNQLGLLIDSEQEMYAWFIQQISKNLHVVFTINDPNQERSGYVLKSPALFNRCILNWMGEWSVEALITIATKMLEWTPIDEGVYESTYTLKDSALFKKPETFKQAVINVIVTLHKDYEKYIGDSTPGLFIDTIKSFQELFAKEVESLEQRQRFTGVGLDNLRETVFKIKRLSEILEQKQAELKEKELEARKMLDTMLVDQNEAERKQEASIEIRKILESQEKEIRDRRSLLIADLATTEPEIQAAQRGVKDIKKQQLTELRSMSNPPNAVKVTLEAVCIILGYRVRDWKDIQLFIRKDDFITSIVNYNTEEMMTTKTRDYIEREYLCRTDFNYSSVNHASKACGPLYRWIVAQVKFSSMLIKVEPLKNEVAAIENEILQTRARLLAAEDMISDYNVMIENSKNEYSKIIRDIEQIKSELKSVELKVNRSKNLLTSLTSEKQRWMNSTKSFITAGKNLVGNCILAGFYTTHCGFHDQKSRFALLKNWRMALSNYNISYDTNFNFCGEMVNAFERTKWVSYGLPNEELYIENFYLLQHGLHYPFIIDPLCKVIEVLQNIPSLKLTVTSFLDEGFIKKVQNTLRFGGYLLLEDGEFFDPILSKVVAKEFKIAGGRQTVQLGDNEVDVSPDFFLIIHTKDQNYEIPPYLKARTTVINFSINKGSIESQALKIALCKEKPDIHNKRQELIKLNSEYNIRLHQLQTQLLEILNGNDADILENDVLVSTLEELKAQSAEIEARIKDTTGVIEEVENIVSEYSSLGEHAVTLYSVLEKMSSIHWSYSITVSHFMQCFQKIFEYDLSAEGNTSRVEHLVLLLYQQTFAMFSPNFVSSDKMVFATLLYAVYYISRESQTFQAAFTKALLLIKEGSNRVDEVLEILRVRDIEEIASIYTYFQNLIYHIDKGNQLIGFAKLAEFLNGTKCYSLNDYVSSSNSTHIIVASEPGSDSTYRIQSLASKFSKDITSIALGSTESTSMAETEISRCSEVGEWILLQNLQMSMHWIKSVLPNRLEVLASDKRTSVNFRVFMTCDLHGTPLPQPLLQTSYKVVHEKENNVIRTAIEVWQIAANVTTSWTSTQVHFAFLLTWFHALLVERCRFYPVGMHEKYEFNDSDFSAALAYFNMIYASVTHQRHTIDPAKIPWEIIRYNIATIIYGGKISDEHDLLECNALACRLFREETLRGAFEIVPGIVAPQDDFSWRSVQEWFLKCPMPDSYTSWVGLPLEIEKEHQLIQAKRIAGLVIDMLGNF